MMKKIFLIGIVLLFTIIAVNAAPSLDVPDSLDLPRTSFNDTVSDSFTIKNNGDVNITDISFSSNADSKYNVTFSGQDNANLTIGDEDTIDIQVYIPADEPTGERTIGNVEITSNEHSTSFPLTIEVVGRLVITNVDVYVDNEQDEDVKDEETISRKPEQADEITFEITVKNTFPTSFDQDVSDIDGIEVIVTIRDIDDEDDLEQEAVDFDLDAGDDNDVVIRFYAPLEIEETEYTVDIDVEGEDGTGNRHGDSMTIYLKGDRKSHKVVIKDAELNVNKLKCSREATLDVEIVNIGDNEEDEVKLEIENTDLEINVKESDIELDYVAYDEDSYYGKSVSINLDKRVKAGTYPMVIRVYYNDDILIDQESVVLTVEDCGEAVEPEEEPEEEEAPEGEAPTEEEKNETVDEEQTLEEEQFVNPIIEEDLVATTTETSFFDNPLYMTLLKTGVVVIAIVLILLIVFVFSPKKK